MRYAIITEKADNNYAAYAPDVPGCAATGATVEEVKQQIVEALEFHFEGLMEDDEAISEPKALSNCVEVKIPVRCSKKKSG